MAQVTRLGLYGGARAPYAGFTSREPSPEVSTTKGGVGDFRTDHLKRLRLQQIRRDDDEIIAIIAAMIKRG